MTQTDRRVLLAFLIPYFSVAFALIVGSVVAYRFALDAVQAETARSNSARLSWSVDTLETRFGEIQGMVDQLELNPFVRRFQSVTRPYEGSTTYQVIDTIRNLPDHSLWNDAVVTYFLLFTGSRHVLAPGVAMSVRDFHHYVLGLAQESHSAWFAQLSRVHHYGTILPMRVINYLDRERPVLLYLRSLGHPGFSQAAVVVAVDRLAIEEILDRVRYTPEGWAILVAEDGTVLASRAGETAPPTDEVIALLTGPPADVRRVGNERLFVSHAASAKMSWSIVSGQSYSAVMASVDRLRRIAIVAIVVVGIVGTLVSVALAYRSSTPIRALLRLFGDDPAAGTEHDPYSRLTAGVSELINDRNTLREAADAQRPLMRAAFADQLLSGRIATASAYRAFTDQLGIQWGDMMSVSAYISIAGSVPLTSRVLSGLLETKAIIRRVLSHLGDAEPLVYDPDETSIAAAFAFSAHDPQAVRARLAAQIEQVFAAVPQTRTWRLRVAFGEFCSNPLDLSRSFQHATTLVATTYLESRVVLWADDHPRAGRVICYPERFRNRLETAIHSADRESAVALVEELIRENREISSMGPGVVRLLFSEVVTGVIRALESAQINHVDARAYVERLVESIGDGTGYGDFEQLIRVVEGACSVIKNNTASHSSVLLRRTVELIDEMIADSSLSLERIADELGISSVYLSRFFKAQTGETFRGYVEAYRMSRARDLLLSSELPVKEIAFAVGFRSLNTFSKAFHRHNHCTASSLRTG